MGSQKEAGEEQEALRRARETGQIESTFRQPKGQRVWARHCPKHEISKEVQRVERAFVGSLCPKQSSMRPFFPLPPNLLIYLSTHFFNHLSICPPIPPSTSACHKHVECPVETRLCTKGINFWSKMEIEPLPPILLCARTEGIAENC